MAKSDPVGKLKVVGTPMIFSRTPCKIEKAYPDVGQDSTEVFNGMLGISIKEIENLQKNKVI
jgi:crotonobetainyl-CoA:carnitine CoA-transferase CaiB-like acyl-CoA transferase